MIERALAGAVESILLRTGPGAVTRALAQEIAGHGGEMPEGCHVLMPGTVWQRLAVGRPMSYKSDARYWLNAEKAGGGAL